MNRWIEIAAAHSRRGEPCVAVTVADVRGSGPREPGAKMIVTADAIEGTIGGGNLEQAAIERARAMLSAKSGAQTDLVRYPLGPDLRQCCGGVVTLLYECLAPCDFQVVLFGAGHVGRAVVNVLGGIDCAVIWIDARKAQFPREVPANVRVVAPTATEDAVALVPPGAYYLVMTHSHALDFEVCERVLARQDSSYLGLIGSLTKRNRFLKNLKLQGVPDTALERLTCPIGVPGIDSKQPGAIAVAVAAELLMLRQRATAAEPAVKPAARRA